MSETAPAGRRHLPAIVVGLVIVVGLAFIFLRDTERPLERSATGMRGIVSWLQSNGVPARVFRGDNYLVRHHVGLRILPIYDTDLRRRRREPKDKKAKIAQTSENDIWRWAVQRKIESTPTLVVLPKWRSGVRLLKVAHKDLLIPPEQIVRLLKHLGVRSRQVVRDGRGLTTETVPAGMQVANVAFLHRQTIAGADCTPLIGTRENMLLGECTIRKTSSSRRNAQKRFRLLTDPDLLSNHGLALAQNGAAALAIVKDLKGKAPVVLDLSVRFRTRDVDPLAVQHQRTWEDFVRLFRWPFAMIWIAFAIVAFLILWRAAMRYGPLAQVYEDEPRASKTVSIDAKARLLRLANHDAALLRSHVQSRLADLVAELLGPHRKPGAEPLAILLPMVSRADPALAGELDAAADMKEPLGDVMGRLDRFENCYDRIRDEFGRTSAPG